MANGFTVEGLQDALRRLESLGAGLDDLSDAVERVAQAGRDAAAQAAPAESGTLAASITAESHGNEGEFGSTLAYAGVQNFGWPAHNIAGSHFLETGADVADDQAGRIVTEAIQDLIRSKGLA